MITLETTTRVYIQLWGPKAICHDALEPIRAGGRGPRGPGGPPRRSAGPRAEGFREKKEKKKKKKKKKKFVRVPPRHTLFTPRFRAILRGNGHMWAPPLYHFVRDFSLVSKKKPV